MTKRMLEVIIIVSILFWSLYFLLYHFYFDKHCLNNDGFIWESTHETMLVMWKCKDFKICSVENIQYDELKRNVESWQCSKKEVYYFESEYYSREFKNLFQ